MSRFAVDPRWLRLPAADHVAGRHLRSATATSSTPTQAFDEYAGWGVTRVVCEEKHMGSRAVAVSPRTADAPSAGSASATA